VVTGRDSCVMSLGGEELRVTVLGRIKLGNGKRFAIEHGISNRRVGCLATKPARAQLWGTNSVGLDC
jgi:hypothetical protein